MFDRDYAKNMITYSDSYEFEVNMDNVKIILTNYNLIKENIYSINLEKQGMFIIKSDDKITLEEFNNTILFPIQNYFGFLSDVYNWVYELKSSVVSSEDRNFHLVDILDTYPFPRISLKEFRPLIQFAKPYPIF